MTEREILSAIFNAVVGLAERVTGEKMTVAVKLESGETLHVCGEAVAWSPIEKFSAKRSASAERFCVAVRE